MENDFMDEDDIDMDEEGGLIHEFECPECSAHNPHPDGFGEGAEIHCFYCGCTFAVKRVGGRIKLKTI